MRREQGQLGLQPVLGLVELTNALHENRLGRQRQLIRKLPIIRRIEFKRAILPLARR